MIRRRAWVPSLCTTLAVTAALLVSEPTVGAKPISKAQCISYDGIANAPKSKIPRDDMNTLRVDPVTRWAAAHPAAALVG